MKEYLIYIVDDEPDILELVDIHLKKAGFKTKKFEDSLQLTEQMRAKQPDLIILDLMLPFTDGLDICKQMRASSEFSNIPVIMLTAKTEEMDRVLGLELGADDYVTKPFSPLELIARVKSVLRRYSEKPVNDSVRKIGNILKIDLMQYKVTVEDKYVDLTTAEFRILELLSSKRGWVFSRDQILNHLWGNEKVVIDRTVDVHINHLRKKLGIAGRFLKNIRGVGYKLEEL
jgi:DNA-binding response OmpR family regulator